MNESVLISVNQKSHRLVAFVVCLLIFIIIYFYIIIVVFADIFLFPFWILSGGQKSQDYIKKHQSMYMFGNHNFQNKQCSFVKNDKGEKLILGFLR